jgi:hypothetical protein
MHLFDVLTLALDLVSFLEENKIVLLVAFVGAEKKIELPDCRKSG